MISASSKTRVSVLAALAVAMSVHTVQAQCSSEASAAAASSHKDIVDTAVAAGKFNTLVTAVQQAGLVDALKGDGPFTVFAPTDAAFAKLPKDTLTNLLKPENKSKLQAILTYHVLPGRFMATDVAKLAGAKTLNGQRAEFKVSGHSAMIDGARIVKTDINTSNGVIHVIDTVILPNLDNIVVTAKQAKTFNTLLTAATEAGLAGTLSDGGPFTVFAPTDEAFAKLPEGTVDSLLQPENRDQLAKILKYHVVSGRVFAKDAVSAGQAQTLAGQKLTITNGKDGVRVNDTRVVMADLDASNGVIHVVDQVILPQ